MLCFFADSYRPIAKTAYNNATDGNYMVWYSLTSSVMEGQRHYWY